MVASSIFLGMGLVLLMLLVQNHKASAKNVGHSDATTSLMLFFEKIHNEIRYGRVIGVDKEVRLNYWRAKLVNDVPALTSGGTPDWLPGAPADPAVAVLYVNSQGRLWRDFQGKGQPLAYMGKNASLKFEWNAPACTLSLKGTVGEADASRKEYDNVAEFNYSIHLSNHE